MNRIRLPIFIVGLSLSLAYIVANDLYIILIGALAFILICTIIVKPLIGLIAIIFFVPFYSLLAWDIGFTISLHQIVIMLTFFAVILNKLVNREGLSKTPYDGFLVAFIFFTATLSLAHIFSIDNLSRIIGGEFRNTYLRTIVQIGHLLVLTCAYFVTINVVNSKNDLRLCIYATFYAAFFTCLCATYQFLADNFSFAFNPLRGINRVGLNFIEDPAIVAGFTRAYVFGMEPKALAGYLFPFLVLWTTIILSKRIIFTKRFTWLIVFFLILNLALYIFTLSCGGIFMLLVSIIVITPLFLLHMAQDTYTKIKIAKVAVVLSAVFLICYAMMQFYGQDVILRILNARAQRIIMFITLNHEDALKLIVAFNIFLQHPIAGIGFGNFSFYYPLGIIAENVPSMFLGVLTETGIIGFFLLVVFIFGSLKYSAGRLSKIGDLFVRQISISLYFTMLAVIVSFLFYRGLYDYYFWIFLGLLKASLKNSIQDEARFVKNS